VHKSIAADHEISGYQVRVYSPSEHPLNPG
jgi:hypothetical protein